MTEKDPGCIPHNGTAKEMQKKGLAPKVTETAPPAKQTSTGKFTGGEQRQTDPADKS